MGDILLDLRSPALRGRSCAVAGKSLRWFPDTAVQSVETDRMSLVTATPGRPDLWGPETLGAAPNRIIVGLAGRVALTSRQWEEASSLEATGGLACRAIAGIYMEEGVGGLEGLDGNMAVVVYDEAAGRCHLVTDPGGALLCYGIRSPGDGLVISSHPDLLASVAGKDQDFDLDRLAEFVVAGQVSHPNTFYRHVEALAPGSVYSFALVDGEWGAAGLRRYYRMEPDFDPAAGETELARELADAFKSSVGRRTLPVLGRTAVAMSGGMDSRAILSCAEDPGRVECFTLVDEENAESRTAAAIAGACGARFHLIGREFDHYGAAAPDGARIGGGMGGLASNHFLGARGWFGELGIENLLTGCYCDYLFKGLALNTRETPWLRRKVLDQVGDEYYRPRFPGALRRRVAGVLERGGEDAGRRGSAMSDRQLFDLEVQRVFPLAAEGDSAQRVIAQRVLPWFAPMADRAVLDVFRRIPPRMKLSGDLFREMLRLVCKPSVLAVPSSNTGAPILAGTMSRAWHRYRSAALNRWNARISGKIASRGSWPNWENYFRTSKLVGGQWGDWSGSAREILGEVVDPSLLERPISAFERDEVELFQRLWTLKLWLEHRLSAPAAPDG